MPIGGGGGGGASSSSSLGFVGCKAYADAVQTISSGVATVVTFNQEEFDTSNFHSTTGPNTSRMTVPTGLAGYYLMTFGSFWNTSPGNVSIYFTKNGTTQIRPAGGSSLAAAAYPPETVAVAQLAVADYVEVSVLQSAGSVGLGHASVLNAMSSFSFVLLGV